MHAAIQKASQMGANDSQHFFDTFQPRIYFSYGLDDEIRPKLTPGAGTQVQYSTAVWLHGHAIHPVWGHVLVPSLKKANHVEESGKYA